MLTCQHRMRPEISMLMQHFYDEPITDAASVLHFPNVRGLDKNLFFLNHSQAESKLTSASTSKVNVFEAQFLAKFCSFLTRQSYEQAQITVLTMYLGQMSEIKRLLSSMSLDEVKVTTVDNYQGEENDFVLLSLVRSNAEGRIGFLQVDNRVCVALSRARKGRNNN